MNDRLSPDHDGDISDTVMYRGLTAEITAMGERLSAKIGADIARLREDHGRMRADHGEMRIAMGDFGDSLTHLTDKVLDTRERVIRIEGERDGEEKTKAALARAPHSHAPSPPRFAPSLKRAGAWFTIVAAVVAILGGLSAAVDRGAKIVAAIAHASRGP